MLNKFANQTNAFEKYAAITPKSVINSSKSAISNIRRVAKPKVVTGSGITTTTRPASAMKAAPKSSQVMSGTQSETRATIAGNQMQPAPTPNPPTPRTMSGQF